MIAILVLVNVVLSIVENNIFTTLSVDGDELDKIEIQ
jgi:hypothetical protein